MEWRSGPWPPKFEASAKPRGRKWVLRASMLNRNAFLHWKVKEGHDVRDNGQTKHPGILNLFHKNTSQKG
ncbi:hypothetical protein NC652_026396 [Populus alba x Populus x berolinensis]|nr:hypothetical protein NC652_026396 [Populus alba x Populus x berolinensis]